ncbi:hypothetical protein EVAR_64410_1 [Eumeta japonica]|uniref:Uncharacterized protein n=1 Tax=Eumeta variegata TaxID=151549 RepID=A0A4C2A054_EUMVA|nr:hypothetical protein EVAR_64410_1 [Eumeta japonica]
MDRGCTSLGDINATVTLTLGREPRPDGEDALACKDLHIQFQIGSAVMHLDNLFDGDDQLGKSLTALL